MQNLEAFLKNKGFERDTYYKTNARYLKKLTNQQNLYVRIFTDTNTLLDVEIEHIALTNFERGGLISLDSIQTFEQLELLITAFGLNPDEEE